MDHLGPDRPFHWGWKPSRGGGAPAAPRPRAGRNSVPTFRGARGRQRPLDPRPHPTPAEFHPAWGILETGWRSEKPPLPALPYPRAVRPNLWPQRGRLPGGPSLRTVEKPDGDFHLPQPGHARSRGESGGRPEGLLCQLGPVPAARRIGGLRAPKRTLPGPGRSHPPHQRIG